MTVAVTITRWALLGLLLGLLSYCSGGTGGTGSPVVAVGPVMAVGSIVVNGIVFDTTSAVVTLDGQSVTAADVRPGHVVTVRGILHTGGVAGTAETVMIDLNVIGPISSIDHAAHRLTVLGQSVRVDDMTHFGATPLNALVIGNIVELSGFADADGVLRATRIDRRQDAFTPGTEIAVDGTITNLDAAQQTFTLNMLRVDFSAARLLDLSAQQLRNGQVVAVQSTRNVVNGVLLADSVASKDMRLQGTPGERVEFAGIITQVSAADTFEVNGQPARLTPATVFERGTATDIALNVRVEVEGFFAADGLIVVEEVEFGAGIERQGLITRVVAPDTFEVDGQLVRATSATVFEGGTAADITLNVRVKVEGFFAADGVLVATEIDFFVEFSGPITRVVAADIFEVDGQPVRVTPATVFEGGAAADIALNVRVEVKGFLAADGVLVAAEIEFL